MKDTPPDRVRLGAFEVDLRGGEVRLGEGSVYLQEQPLAVLRMLIERDGEIVIRDEIKQRLWPNDTVVDFDHGINAAIRKLRLAFDDSADEPKYIGTIARRGYRLLMPIERVPTKPTHAPAAAGVPEGRSAANGTAVCLQPQAGLIGKKVSHYRVLEVIGGGGMGMVYKAEDLKLGRQVALKFLPEELAADPIALQRFEREARAASSLDHPNICTIHEVEEHDGQPFIVMQLLQGETLRERLSAVSAVQKKLPLDELLEIAIQIGDGLQAAHAKGIIHRDIKPANIFLTSSGQVKVLDFGLAKLISATEEGESDGLQQEAEGASVALRPARSRQVDETLTRLGSAMGTAGYMSPEQVRGENLDMRTDLFSLGLVLYEMATGQRAFSGETASVVHDAILNRTPKSLRDLNSTLPPELEQIISKAMAKNREERCQSATEIRGMLARLRHEQESQKTRSKGKTAFRFADSIAVLPFENPYPEMEYLSDGIAETITNRLSQIASLRVVPHSVASQFKRAAIEPALLRKELDVRLVLTGHLVQHGESLVVGAELIDAVREAQLWGKTFNRKIDDIFLIQDEIGQEIANHLHFRLTEAETTALSKWGTDSREAYLLRTKALYWAHKWTPEAVQKSFRHIQQAIDADPAYAEAYADLGYMFAIAGMFEYAPPAEMFPRAQAAARKAIDIDDNLADAHAVYAFTRIVLDWDFLGAEYEALRAIELGPRVCGGYYVYSQWCLTQCRFDEAIAAARKTVELDPLTLFKSFHLGATYLYARRYANAIEHLKQTLEIDPSFWMVHIVLALAHARIGNYHEAVAAAGHCPDDLARKTVLGMLAAIAGKRDDALAILHELMNEQSASPRMRYRMAGIHAELGDLNAAFECLGKALEGRTGQIVYLAADPSFDNLRDDPRWVDVLRRVGLVSTWYAADVKYVAENSAPTLQQSMLDTGRGPSVAQGYGNIIQHETPVVNRRSSRMVASLVLFLVASLIGFGLFYRSRLAKRLTEKETIVLGDFVNRTGDAVFDDTLKTALNISLAQSPFLNVLPEDRIRSTLQLMTRPVNSALTPELVREVCLRTGSQAYIAGSIASLGSEYVLGLKAVNCQDGVMLAQQQFTARSKEQILDALGQAAVKLRSDLGESLSTVQKFDVSLPEATTSSIEALKEYSLGLREHRETGRRADLIHFERAVQLDPSFAMAYKAAAWDYRDLGEVDRSVEYYTKAFELREHASDREKLLIAADYYLWVTGALDKALQAYQGLAESYPRYSGAYFNLANVYAWQGQYEKAQDAYRESLRLIPEEGRGYDDLVTNLICLQRFGEVRQVISDRQARGEDSFVFRLVLYEAAFLAEDSPTMAEQQRWFAARSSYASLGFDLGSDSAAYKGRLREARALRQQAVDSAVRSDQNGNAAVYLEDAAVLEGFFGNAAEAKRAATAGLKLVPSNKGVEVEAALALAIAGDAAQSQSLAAELDKRYPIDTQVQSLWLPAIQAQLSLHRKNAASALETLQAALPPIEWGNIVFINNASCLYHTYIRGYAYLQAGQGSAAAAEFQKILDHGGIVGNCPTGALARLGLGRANALEARSLQGPQADAARKRALAAYEDFLTLWKNADADVPIYKQANAEYAKLQSSRLP